MQWLITSHESSLMNDMSEEEEEQFVRENARRMKVSPWRLLQLIQPLGFQLLRSSRDHGINEMEFVRDTPGYEGLFDLFSVHSNIYGDPVSVSISTAITPGRFHHGITDTISRSGQELGEFQFQAPTQQKAKQIEHRIAELIPVWFDLLEVEQPAFHEVTRSARTAVTRYLVELAPSNDLHETWSRLLAAASREQHQLAEKLLKTQFLTDLNLASFRLVWEICQLMQVLHWEHELDELRGLIELKTPATELQIEAHRRLQILASRLAREPGWPSDDPLVPVRNDELLDPAPWRDTKLDRTGAAIEEYLETTAQSCPCGKPWRLRNHRVEGSGESGRLLLMVRCAAGHEHQLRVNADAL